MQEEKRGVELSMVSLEFRPDCRELFKYKRIQNSKRRNFFGEYCLSYIQQHRAVDLRIAR